MADDMPLDFSFNAEVCYSAGKDLCLARTATHKNMPILTKFLDEAEERPEVIPRIFFHGLERLHSQDSTSPAQSYGDCSSVAPTPSLSATSLQEEDFHIREPILDNFEDTLQVSIFYMR